MSYTHHVKKSINYSLSNQKYIEKQIIITDDIVINSQFEKGFNHNSHKGSILYYTSFSSYCSTSSKIISPSSS